MKYATILMRFAAMAMVAASVAPAFAADRRDDSGRDKGSHSKDNSKDRGDNKRDRGPSQDDRGKRNETDLDRALRAQREGSRHQPDSDLDRWLKAHPDNHRDDHRRDNRHDRRDDRRYWDSGNRRGDGNDRRDDRHNWDSDGWRGDDYRWSAPPRRERWIDFDRRHHDELANQWGDLGLLSLVVAILGISEHNDVLVLAGVIGGLYSVGRYDSERYSDDRDCRLRADLYSHRYVTFRGERYERRTVHRHGEDYFEFVRNR